MAFIPVFGKKKRSTKDSQSSFGAALADLNKRNTGSEGSPFAPPKDPKHTSGARQATSRTTPNRNTAKSSSSTAKHTRPRTPEVNPPQPVESSPEDAAAEHAGSDMEEPQQLALEPPVRNDDEPKKGKGREEKKERHATKTPAKRAEASDSGNKVVAIPGKGLRRDHQPRGPLTRALTNQPKTPKDKKTDRGAEHPYPRGSSPAREPDDHAEPRPRRASTFGNDESPSPPRRTRRVSTDPSKPRRNPLAFNLLTGKHSEKIERRY